MNNNFTEEIIEKVIKWKEYCDNGHYGSSKDIVDTYNIVFNGIKQKQAYTQCGSCLRRCCFAMYDEYIKYKAELDASTVVNDTGDEVVTKKPVGRPRKNS